MMKGMKDLLRDRVPAPLLRAYRFARVLWRDLPDILAFIFGRGYVTTNFLQRTGLVARFYYISGRVECAHWESEMLRAARAMLSLPASCPGCFVEAGCYKGGGTAKFSLIAKLAGRKLVVFDSFEGLPGNEEKHDKSILGHSVEGWFSGGKFRGGLEEVRANVEKYGAIEQCEFIKGWFNKTMPAFRQKVSLAYLDVDLAESTKDCLKYLYPLLSPGGVLISQDGDFPLVIAVFADDRFWREEVGCPKPASPDLGRRKLLKYVKSGAK